MIAISHETAVEILSTLKSTIIFLPSLPPGKMYKEEMAVQEEMFNKMYSLPSPHNASAPSSSISSIRAADHQTSRFQGSNWQQNNSKPRQQQPRQPQQQYIPDIDELTSQSDFFGDEFMEMNEDEERGDSFYGIDEEDDEFMEEDERRLGEQDSRGRPFSKTRRLTLHYKH